MSAISPEYRPPCPRNRVRHRSGIVSVMGRNTQGVRLIRIEEGHRLVGLARIEAIEDEGDDD